MDFKLSIAPYRAVAVFVEILFSKCSLLDLSNYTDSVVFGYYTLKRRMNGTPFIKRYKKNCVLDKSLS